jgi:hypothetical protein
MKFLRRKKEKKEEEGGKRRGGLAFHVVDTLNNDLYSCMVSLSSSNYHQSARLLQPLSNEQNLQEYICMCKSL